MALARPQGSIGTGGLKAAAIGFAVAAVAAITFAIIMFTQQSDLQAAADQAAQRAQQQDKEATQAKQDLRATGQEVIGQEAETFADIKAAIDQTRQTVAGDPDVKQARIQADTPVNAMLNSLYKLYRATADQARKLEEENKSLDAKLKATLAEVTAKSEAFDARIDELTKQYEELTRQSEQFRNEANRQLEELQAARTKEREDMARELDAARKAKEDAEKALRAEKNRADELLAQLAQFKPSAEGGSALQVKDGTIVRTVPAGDAVYIDLGRRNRIKPGMTFSVYSPVRGIPADGKGKATIEVTNVFETTSECRVTSRVPDEPILVNDIIANPVYDRSRQYRFTVAGDFDLNFDGQTEDVGGKEVTRLIERMGGKVVSTVSSDTDFLVLGSPPPPPIPVVPGAENEAALAERNAELTLRRQTYETMLKEARSLSIPILTRTQFLHFLGQSMPPNAPDDAAPSF